MQFPIQITKLEMSKRGVQLTSQTVHGYKIIKEIGQGKFSYVYRAEKEDGIPYALKSIKIFDIADQKQRQKCMKQVELMKVLNHPNIIKYIDSFIENNQLYIVTEWAQKGDLKKMIKQHTLDEIPFEESIIWEYIAQIASALKHMHEKKIMHRDLKPANIFISHDMSLKIGDLGLGRAFSPESLYSHSKVGTPLYMSPQLIQDSGYYFNADVWSIGCITYELCELSSPFRNKHQKMSLENLFDNIINCKYKPISNRYSPQLSQLIKKMIVMDPNCRLSSEQVLQIAERNLKNIKKPLLDPYIVMDDIHTKLNLLNYTIKFCKVAERTPVDKYYFAIRDLKVGSEIGLENQQLNYFLELCYWVLGLSRAQNSQNMSKNALIAKTHIDWSSCENACRKLLVDLSVANIRVEDIDAESILNGYGETVCYLLNEVLNRELIRSNFKFQQPSHAPILNDIEPLEQENEPTDQKAEDEIDEQSMEQQSQFEQSIFFHKGNKKIGKQDEKLLQKIQQYGGDEEDKEMIMPRVDEFEWKTEYLRVEKRLNEITTYAREARKKHGHLHIDQAKICSSKITDLIRAVKPTGYSLYNRIDTQLQAIKRGENSINGHFKQVSTEFSQKNHEFNRLVMKSENLASELKARLQKNEKIEQKIQQFQHKIKIASSENENSRVGDIKQTIINLQQEIRSMEQRQGILLWMVRQQQLKFRQSKPSNQLEEFESYDLT